jgi:phosphomethylpyrimidine synthase
MSDAITFRYSGNQKTAPLELGGGSPPRIGLLVGVTPPFTSAEQEIQKVEKAVELGASTITDLSIGLMSPLRPHIIERILCPIGTVPMYEVFARFKRGEGTPRKLVMDVLKRQSSEGVSFFSIHPSLSRKLAEDAINGQRVIPITSRGGGMLLELMRTADCENPFLELWDEISGLCEESGIVLSLVGSLRPGATEDALESVHLRELEIQAQLIQRAKKLGVQLIVELLNHVRLSSLPTYMQLAQQLFAGTPIGALGPTPTDIAIGYDDVAGAIGAAVAIWHGADWVNCTTAGEHTHLPDIDESLRAVRMFVLAAHIGYTARSNTSERDLTFSKARARNAWRDMERLSIFPDIAAQIIDGHQYAEGAACTMCGSECPLVRTRKVTAKRIGNNVPSVNYLD